ncbi:hypothetical protein HK104_006844, partial [Borealophlyctis nickersoniae]
LIQPPSTTNTQPLTGILGSRGREDEFLVGELLSSIRSDYASTFCHPEHHSPDTLRLWIFDARAFTAALGNNVRGGGFENT